MGEVNSVSQYQVDEATDWNAAPPPIRRRMSHSSLLGAYIFLLLFMFIYCARPQDWIPGLVFVPLEKISGFLALAALGLSIWSIRQRLPREVIYLILLTGQLFVAAFTSPVWRAGAFQKTVDFAKVLLIVIVITLSIRTMARLRLLIFVQALSVAVIAAVTVWKGDLIQGRLVGVLGNNYADSNDLALAIIIALPLCLALLILGKSFLTKAFWTVAMLAMTYGVFLTGSRGGLLALTVTAAICLWEFGIRGQRLFIFVVAALAGVVFWQFAGGLLNGRLKGTFDAKQDVAAAYDSGQAREQLLWQSIAVTFEHPLFGVGSGNFQQISGSWHETHNSFTQMSSEGGIPALILYALILWTGFKNLRTVKRFARGRRDSSLLAAAFWAALAGYIVGSTFLSVGYQFFPYFFVAYTTALAQVTKRSSVRPRDYESENRTAAHEGFVSLNVIATDSLQS